MTSDAAQIFVGEKQVEAGVSKADMCRGVDKAADANIKVTKPAKVMARGYTTVRPYFVALPLINSDDPETQRILAARDQRREGKSRSWNFNLHSVQMWGHAPYRPTAKKRGGTQRVLRPIEFGQEYQLARLSQSNVAPCWSRLVVRGGEYFWQLTYEVTLPKVVASPSILGIHLGIDLIVSWCLLGADVTVLERGQIRDNPILKAHEQATRAREAAQRAGRWVGGRSHADHLETLAHQLVHRLLDIAQEKQAWLAVEKLEWVDKKGHRAAQNLRFSGWNYGQLRRYLDYKAPLEGHQVPFEVRQFVMDLTCPRCGALRQAGQHREDANTWLNLKTRVLECRKCHWSGEVTAEEKAEIAARWAFKHRTLK